MNPGDYRLVYQWAPLFPVGQWWQLALIALFLLAVGGTWYAVMRRESRYGWSSWISFLFRVLPLAVLFVFCLNPQRISEQRIVQPSEVGVLLDTSLSMSLRESSDANQSVGRFQELAERLQQSQLFSSLSEQHQVTIFTFDQNSEAAVVGVLPRTSRQPQETNSQWLGNDQEVQATFAAQQWQRIRPWIISGTVALAMGILVTLAGLILAIAPGRRRSAASHAALAKPSGRGRALTLGIGMLAICGGIGFWSVGDLLETHWSLRQKLAGIASGTQPDMFTDREPKSGQQPNSQEDQLTEVSQTTQFLSQVFPAGTETRLGDALRSVTDQYAGRSLAGLVIASDGNQNAGTDPLRAAATLGQANIPIQVLAVGPLLPAPNAQLISLDAPAKVLPKSPFKLKGYYRTQNMAGEKCHLELCLVDPESGEVRDILETREITGRGDDSATAFEFDRQGAAAGRQTYLVRIVTPVEDFSPNDNSQLTEVSVVDRRNHVLLMAGGPSREFRFLRNLLYRDPMVESDVWLQSMDIGADQEAAKILTGFPLNMEELDQYDCLVAFDPDWTQLSAQQSRDLEQWVSQRGGGLISIAGPVFTPEWSIAPRGNGIVDPIRRLYPVSFFGQGSAQAKVGRFGGKEPFPLNFTREGTSVDFLSLTNDPLSSRQAWEDFTGVYGYYAVNEAKPGAQVLAYFSDPSTMMGQRMPIYLASQFVGKGRVFFQASGEMWRIRRWDVNYFQTYYTKLIRWASQGRLLRDSQRGNLLVDKQRCWLGDSVQLLAQLEDAQGRPLAKSEVTVTARLPSGATQPVVLQSQEDSPGEYLANLPLREEGPWRFFLPVPDATDGATLQATVSVQLSDLEKRESQRNQALLEDIARLSQGKLLDLEQLTSPEVASDFLGKIEVRELESIEPGVVDRQFSRRWLTWMVVLFVAYFCSGWIYRRMNHLA